MSVFRVATLALLAAVCVGCGSSKEQKRSADASVNADAGDSAAADAGDANVGDAAPDVSHTCFPSCVGKTCGDDGCGGSCGTCPQGQGCSDKGTCVSACPCFYNECLNCYCATAAEQYAVANDCAIPVYDGNEGALLSCSGSSTAPATWSVGTQCSNGCVVAPPKTPD